MKRLIMEDDQFSQLLLYTHDSHDTWEDQLNRRGAAMAELVNYHEKRKWTLSAATISDLMLPMAGDGDIHKGFNHPPHKQNHNDEKCELSGFLQDLHIDSSSARLRPSIIQCNLKSALLKQFCEELVSEPLKVLSKKLSQDTTLKGSNRDAEETDLQILFGSVLCVEARAYGTRWFKPESSTYTIIFPLLPVESTPDYTKLLSVWVAFVSLDSQEVPLGEGEDSQKFRVIKDKSKHITFNLAEGQLIVLKEGNMFRLNNIGKHDSFVLCMSASIVRRKAQEPILSPCLMLLQELYTEEDLLTSNMLPVSRSPDSFGALQHTSHLLNKSRSTERFPFMVNDSGLLNVPRERDRRTPSDDPGMIWSTTNAKTVTQYPDFMEMV